MLIRTQANEDLELFLRTHEAPLVIDEFQYAPNLLSYIKILVDDARKNEMFGNKNEVGTLYYLTGYTDAEILEKSAYSGAIFETYIVSEIIKSYTNNGIDPRKHLYFYRDNNQKEIDLLIIDNNIVYPVEIKKSSNPTKDAIKNFDVVNKFEMEVGEGIVLCLCKDIIAIDENNYYVPVEYI